MLKLLQIKFDPSKRITHPEMPHPKASRGLEKCDNTVCKRIRIGGCVVQGGLTSAIGNWALTNHGGNELKIVAICDGFREYIELAIQ